MRISDKGAGFIASFEKEVLHVYDDGYGFPTAGIGHRVNLPLGTAITKEQSREWWKADLAKYGGAVDRSVTVHVTQNQFDMLTSLCFNIGIGAFQQSSLVRRLNRSDYAGCADGFLAWNKSNKKVSKGLDRRRKAERAIFLTPDNHKISAVASTTGDPTALDGQALASGIPSVSGSIPSLTEQPPTSTIETTTVETTGTPPDMTETTTIITASEPVTVKNVAMGIWSKVVAGIAGLTALGINAGTVIQTKLSEITLNQVFIAALGVVLLIVVIWYVKKRQESADLKTHLLIEAAAAKDKNAVILTK